MTNGAIHTFLKRKVLAVQEFTNLLVDSIRQVFSPPRYVVDTLMQMDVIGFGSLPIVLLTGFFTGGVLALQSYRTLGRFGETGLSGTLRPGSDTPRTLPACAPANQSHDDN